MMATAIRKLARAAVLLCSAAVAAAAPAAARPDPCLDLSAIVSAYSNTSSNQGRTAAELFAEMGQLTVMARLGEAAAHLQDHEVEGPLLNVVAPNADTAYAELSQKLRWLDAADLQPYAGVPLAPANVASPFCTTGLLGGVYVRENAGLLVGRMTDALFVAFRATNDGWSITGAPLTPDAYDWTHLGHHYGQYRYILPALEGYLAAHPEITRVYLAGNSLGGAMVQRYLQLHRGDARLSGITFGSPGTPTIAFQDSRQWSFHFDIDPLILVPNLKYKVSGKRFILHIGQAPAVPPNADYHSPQAYYRALQHLDEHGIGRSYLVSKFAGSITRWNAISLRLRMTADHPEEYVAGLPGTLRSLPGSTPRVMAGGDRGDRLVGGIGAGDLFGFAGADCLDGLHRPEQLFGGAGPDVFLLHGNYLAFGGDVMDFEPDSDRLVLLSTLLPYTPLVDGRNFIRGTVPRLHAPSLLYDRSSGRLWFDMDGTGLLPAVEVARLRGRPALAAGDISFVVPVICR